MSPVQLVLYLGFPWVAGQLAARFRPAKVLGPVVLCYAAGIILANLPWRLETQVALGTSEAAVPLAIPLLLFQTDLREWPKLARSLLLSFVLACASAVAAALLVGRAMAAHTDEWWKVAGMLVGVYVGGTANMSAVGVALGVRQETFVLLNAADVVMGGLYLLVCLSVGQRLLLRLLPRFVEPQVANAAPHAAQPAAPRWGDRAQALGLALLVVGLSAGGVWLVAGRLHPAAVLLCITSGALALSLSRRVQALEGSDRLGDYALLVFCVSVGSLADARLLTGASVTLFLFVAAVMGVAVLLHVGLSAALRLDADTTLVTSAATIFGPAFIGPVTTAIGNRHLTGPGVTLGLAGIALGTYLGLATAWVLRTLG